jgi:hypothetical protein
MPKSVTDKVRMALAYDFGVPTEGRSKDEVIADILDIFAIPSDRGTLADIHYAILRLPKVRKAHLEVRNGSFEVTVHGGNPERIRKLLKRHTPCGITSTFVRPPWYLAVISWFQAYFHIGLNRKKS